MPEQAHLRDLLYINLEFSECIFCEVSLCVLCMYSQMAVYCVFPLYLGSRDIWYSLIEIDRSSSEKDLNSGAHFTFGNTSVCLHPYNMLHL